MTQTQPISASGSTVTLNVDAIWADDATDSTSASVVLNPPCQQPPPNSQTRRHKRTTTTTAPVPVQVGGVSAARAVVAGATFTG